MSPAEWKRWPCETLPLRMPMTVASTTLSPCSMTIQWIGRTNSASPAPQRMRRGIGNDDSAFSTRPGRSSAAVWPFSSFSNVSHSPFSVCSRLSSPTSTPHFFAKASAAGVGLPSSSNAMRTGGPFWSTFRSSCAAASPVTITDSRRGLANVATSPRSRRASSIAAVRFSPNASMSERSAFGGSSSVPISTRKSLLTSMLRPVGRSRPSESRALHGLRSRRHR